MSKACGTAHGQGGGSAVPAACLFAFSFQDPGQSASLKGAVGQKWFVTPREEPPVAPHSR